MIGGDLDLCRAAHAVTHRKARIGAMGAVYWVVGSAWGGPDLLEHGSVKTADDETWDELCRSLARLVRCIFGNPFRPVTVEPRWRTSTVVGLARGIYADRAFDRLPILADALMDAGCDSDDVLNHCRHDPTHARGCWVVDLVLGKT